MNAKLFVVSALLFICVAGCQKPDPKKLQFDEDCKRITSYVWYAKIKSATNAYDHLVLMFKPDTQTTGIFALFYCPEINGNFKFEQLNYTDGWNYIFKESAEYSIEMCNINPVPGYESQSFYFKLKGRLLTQSNNFNDVIIEYVADETPDELMIKINEYIDNYVYWL